MEALKAQTVGLEIKVIDRIAPWARAANMMVEKCRTELLIQVDEDMLLDADAVEKLIALIDAQDASCVMAAAPLWDEDLEMVIYGIKVYRHALVKQVPFEHHLLGDGHDRERWAAHGFTVGRAPADREHCIGRHGTDYTPEEAFNRWRSLWQRQRRGGHSKWVEEWLPKLIERFSTTDSRRDLFAMLGAVIGATEEPWPDDAGPDFSRPNPVLERLTKLL